MSTSKLKRGSLGGGKNVASSGERVEGLVEATAEFKTAAPKAAAPKAARRQERPKEGLSFGELLHLCREERHLSQTALADRIRKSTSLISLLESGGRRPTREILTALSTALELDTQEDQRLCEAAGYTTNDVSGAVQRIVDVMSTQLQLDDANQALMHSELASMVNGWRGLFTGMNLYHQGHFAEAQARLSPIATHPAYTPKMKAQARVYLAETLLQRGELSSADALIRQARTDVQQLQGQPDWAPEQLAEIQAVQAMMAVRLGRYSLARKLLDQSILIYQQMARGSGQSANYEHIAYFGLGKCYKRLAQVALFEGNPEDAFKHCISAEADLRLAPPSALREQWLRRTGEMKAWALAEFGDFEKALELRERIRRACEEVGDTYGVCKGALYIADDYRRQLKNLLVAAGVDTCRTYADRRAMIQSTLGGPQALHWLAEAERYYREALQGLDALGQMILLGRCLRNLGIILRYKGTLNDSEQEYDDAQSHFDRALTLERAIGQGRRIPSIYESLAELAWDRGEIRSTIHYYHAAIEALDDPRITSTDTASDDLRARAAAALERLDSSAARVRWRGGVDGSESWRIICQRLIDLTHTYIQQHHLEPTAWSDRTPEWLAQMRDLEARDPNKPLTRRLLAQNRLSAALALSLPAAYPPATWAMHSDRFYDFQQNVQVAATLAGNAQCHDLCCRLDVVRGLESQDTRPLVYEQVRQAAAYLHDYPRGYGLDAGLYQLPLAFAIKGERVLLEVPDELASCFSEPDSAVVRPESALCYAIADSTLALPLAQIFDELVRQARESVAKQESTEQWLTTITHPREVQAGFRGGF